MALRMKLSSSNAAAHSTSRGLCSVRPVLALAPQAQRAVPRLQCRAVSFNDELQALLQSAMERSSCEVADRVGIIGLKLRQGSKQSKETGEMLWEAGVQMACYLRDYMHKDMHGMRVLELGSGIGLVGLTCACFGGKVLLTDLPQVLPITEENINANAHVFSSAGGAVDLAVLDWQQPAADIVAGPWDLIVGSDLVFERHHADELAPLLAGLINANPRAQVLMAHAHRDGGLDDYMTEVFAAHGLRIKEAVRTGEDIPEQDISVVSISCM